QRIGFVVTALSRNGIALIAPTNDPSAAVSALERGARRRGPLGAASHAGISYKLANASGVPLAIGAVGHYAVVGGTAAFDAIVDAYRGSSLAQQPAFATAFNALAPAALVRAYADGPRALAAVTSLPTLSPQARQQLRAVLAS